MLIFMKKAFKLDSLYMAKLGQSPITDGNDDTLFILQRNLIDFGNSPLIYETYTDTILDAVIAANNTVLPAPVPPEIETLMPFPKEYCTDEELEYGLISDLRIYEIFREVNFNRDRNR